MQTAKRNAILALLVLLVLSGCAKQVQTHPNQINAFDGIAYDTLITVQASLNQAKAEVAKPDFQKYRPQLNQAIAGYNTAIAAYKLYHTSGTPSADQTATLQSELLQLTGDVGKLLGLLGVKL